MTKKGVDVAGVNCVNLPLCPVAALRSAPSTKIRESTVSFFGFYSELPVSSGALSDSCVPEHSERFCHDLLLMKCGQLDI